MILAAALVSAFFATPRIPVLPVQPESSCLHAAGQETPKERDRSVAALGATRAINTAESAYAAAQARNATGRTYARREELAGYIDGARYNLAANADIAPGFKLTLDTTEKGYWFSVTDKTDPCGFRYISNQDGVIFAAQPIR
jgi:hypothetical protein